MDETSIVDGGHRCGGVPDGRRERRARGPRPGGDRCGSGCPGRCRGRGRRPRRARSRGRGPRARPQPRKSGPSPRPNPPNLNATGRARYSRRSPGTHRGAPTYRDQPARRPLRIYSFDPMLANTLERVGPGVVTVEIPWEPLWFGPRGARVVVTDYDSSRRINDKPAPGYYEPGRISTRRVWRSRAGSRHRRVIRGSPSRWCTPSRCERSRPSTRHSVDAFAVRRPASTLSACLPWRERLLRPDLKAVLFGYFQADRRILGRTYPVSSSTPRSRVTSPHTKWPMP